MILRGKTHGHDAKRYNFLAVMFFTEIPLKFGTFSRQK